MSWIKHNNIRTNMSKIVEYSKDGNTDIKLFAIEDGRPKEWDQLSFKNEKTRDIAMEELDRAVNCKSITGVKSQAGVK